VGLGQKPPKRSVPAKVIVRTTPCGSDPSNHMYIDIPTYIHGPTPTDKNSVTSREVLQAPCTTTTTIQGYQVG